MPQNIVFIVTGADHIANSTPILRRERYIEYMVSLHKIFNYAYPVYGVLSEYDIDNTVDTPPFNKFPFRKLIYINHGLLESYNKSESEIYSIRKLLDAIDTSEIDDDTIIIKVSGRYLVLDDTFISMVKDNISNMNVSGVMCTNNTNHVFTFLYALRYSYFKTFYREHIYNNIPVEYNLYSYLKNTNIVSKIINIKRLGILANISNENNFQII